MPQFCSRCSRANPEEAIFCFFDGFMLHQQGHELGPLAVGSRRFPSPFIFPSGRVCSNFDELALACYQEWQLARSMLHEGYLESFLEGLGRSDLARLAKASAAFPDPDQGLDQFLAELPSSVLLPAKMRVDPTEVNLGILDSEQERSFELELENQGMRLLFGSVSTNEPWLLLGEEPGSAKRKRFHFTHDSRIHVRVLPQRLRASEKLTEGTLLIQSNVGEQVVRVRAEKHIQPFPHGPLAGAKTPRQIAELAQAKPKDVAPLFESGEVQRWYVANGWIYPVKIPAASGVACIQQFFEALAFSKPPKVSIDREEVALYGLPGEEKSFFLLVSTTEKKPVYAHATCSADWLVIDQPVYRTKSVRLKFSVLVPDRPGETWTTTVEVFANGKTYWCVPVTLTIEDRLAAHPGTSELSWTTLQAFYSNVRRRSVDRGRRMSLWWFFVVLTVLLLVGVMAVIFSSR